MVTFGNEGVRRRRPPAAIVPRFVSRFVSRFGALLGALLAPASLLSADAALRATAASGDEAASATALASRSFVLHAGVVYTGSAGVLRDATIVVCDGKIAAILDASKRGDVPAGLTVHDLPAHVVIPGLIDAATTIASDPRDTLESIAPEVRALDGWDFFRDARDLLEGGVTTVFVSPGVESGRSSRLVSGRGAIVKTAGHASDPLRRVLRDAIGVQVTLGERSRRQPPVYDPPVAASPDNPFEVARPPLPQSRIGEFLALRDLLERSREYDARLDAYFVDGAPEPLADPEVAALLPLIDGRDHLRVRADKARDIYHLLELARESRVPIVLEGAAEAEALAPWLVAAAVPVILPGGFEPGRLPGGDLASPAIEGRLADDAIVRLHEAGVGVVVHSPSSATVSHLLLQASAAVRVGMDPLDALRTITLAPARVLGIDDRVGSLDVGKDADMVILGGDPFGPANQPQAVVIDGEIVWREAPDVAADATVVRCGRILTAAGDDIRAGVIVVRGGKIDYVGPGALLGSLDKVARAIDATSWTVVPGWIDAGGTAGLRVDDLSPGFGARVGEGGASSSATLRLVDSIDPRDPSLRDLVRAGFTTAIIAPPPGRDVSGQVSALKLAAANPAAAVISSYAALAFGGVSGRTLKSAKDYDDAIKKWEAARDEAKAKGTEFKDEAPKTQDAFEPFRAVIAGKVPVLVEASSKATLDAAVKALKEGLGARILVSGLRPGGSAKDLDALADLIRGATEGVVLAPPLIATQRRETINWPEELTTRGIIVSLSSRVATGARLLPLEVAYAVRDGWDARQALRAMTLVPARQFGIADRIGSIEKGKDADLVFLSGEPFALATRVLGVMVDGRVVHGVDGLESHVEE